MKQFFKQLANHKLLITASQNEATTQSVYLNADGMMSPKQKHQSTSPNLPLNETIINEEEVKSETVQ